MSFRRKITATLMIIWGMLMVGGSILVIEDEVNNNIFNADIIIILLMLGVLPLFLGVWLLWEGNRNAKATKIAQNQENLLAHARASQGKITITEAALVLKKSIAEAKAALDELHAKEIFEIEISQEGALEYVLRQKLDNNQCEL